MCVCVCACIHVQVCVSVYGGCVVLPHHVPISTSYALTGCLRVSEVAAYPERDPVVDTPRTNSCTPLCHVDIVVPQEVKLHHDTSLFHVSCEGHIPCNSLLVPIVQFPVMHRQFQW